MHGTRGMAWPVAAWLLVAGLLLTGLGPAAPALRADDEAGVDLPVRVVPVGALVQGWPDHTRVRSGVAAPGTVQQEDAPLFGSTSEERFLPLGTPDELVELVRSAVAPPVWEEVEGVWIRPLDEQTLAVRAEASVLDDVLAWLAGVEARYLRPLRLELRLARLADEDLAGAVGTTVEAPPGEVVASAGLLGYSGQRVSAFLGAERALLLEESMYVAEGAHVAVPQVGLAHLGLSVEMVATLPDGERRATVDLEMGWAGRPEDPTARGAMLPIDLAPVDTMEAKASLRVPEGRWVLAARPGADAAGPLALWLRVAPQAVAHRPSRAGAFSFAPARTEPGGAWTLRDHDVRDLVRPVAPQRARPSHLFVTDFVGACIEEEEPRVPIQVDNLVELLRESLGDWAWWEDPASIELRSGHLLVRQREGMQEQVAASLAALREGRLWSSALEARRIEISEEWLADPAEGLVGARYEGVVAAAVARAREAGEVVVDETLSVVAQGGARQAATAGREVGYVAAFQGEIASHMGSGHVVVHRVLDGSIVEAQCAPTTDGGALSVELTWSRTRLRGERRIDLPAGEGAAPAQLALPTLLREDASTSFLLPLGEPTVVASWSDGITRRLLVLTANVR